MDYELSEALKSEILKKSFNTEIGLLKIPHYIIEKVRKETCTPDTDYVIQTKIQNFINRCS